MFPLGGEEFLIVLPETNIELAQANAERIRKNAETTSSPIGKPVTVSMGIGNSPETTNHFLELFNLTDQALYNGKQDGRNNIVIAHSSYNCNI